jgi:hypothetical protein
MGALLETLEEYARANQMSFETHHGRYRVEKVLAERKTFISRKKLEYRAEFAIDDQQKELRFTESLKESGRGMDAGVGVQSESYNTLSGARKGSFEDHSRQLGKHYDASVDYGAIREAIKGLTEAAGYSFSYLVTTKGL